eukprot:CAMPEP_0180134408 /NCGR_PEP_ID=MMETSP0986-20121125/10145_1 /TAXON_ID=697907 /ORGANISM="non described non described, Strain CCMP2293" /LENGTH=65 /DNA_ID=CAMNT_0022074765 /DNA_START=158 /DNA_END=355 /DNA_ORIENTATION=-
MPHANSGTRLHPLYTDASMRINSNQTSHGARRPYPLSGQTPKFAGQEVLGRSSGPTVGRMRLLAT